VSVSIKPLEDRIVVSHSTPGRPPSGLVIPVPRRKRGQKAAVGPGQFERAAPPLDVKVGDTVCTASTAVPVNYAGEVPHPLGRDVLAVISDLGASGVSNTRSHRK
jgi:co-chaperonin GroES (HSP10)